MQASCIWSVSDARLRSVSCLPSTLAVRVFCFNSYKRFSHIELSSCASALGLFIPLCALLFILHRCAVAAPIRDAKFSAQFTERLHTAFSDRTKRAVLVVVLYMFGVVSVLAIKGMSCYGPPSGSVLLADPTQVPLRNLLYCRVVFVWFVSLPLDVDVRCLLGSFS